MILKSAMQQFLSGEVKVLEAVRKLYFSLAEIGYKINYKELIIFYDIIHIRIINKSLVIEKANYELKILECVVRSSMLVNT